MLALLLDLDDPDIGVLLGHLASVVGAAVADDVRVVETRDAGFREHRHQGADSMFLIMRRNDNGGDPRHGVHLNLHPR